MSEEKNTIQNVDNLNMEDPRYNPAAALNIFSRQVAQNSHSCAIQISPDVARDLNMDHIKTAENIHTLPTGHPNNENYMYREFLNTVWGKIESLIKKGQETNPNYSIWDLRTFTMPFTFTTTGGNSDMNIENVRFRIRPVPSLSPSLIVRPLTIMPMSIAGANLPQDQMDTIMSTLDSPGGVLIAGVYCSGKTTTTAVIINEYAKKKKNVVMDIESPVEIFTGNNDESIIYQIDTNGYDGPPEKLPSVLNDIIRKSSAALICTGENATPEHTYLTYTQSFLGKPWVANIHGQNHATAIQNLFDNLTRAGVSETEALKMIANTINLIVYQELYNGTDPKLTIINLNLQQNRKMFQDAVNAKDWNKINTIKP